MKNASAAHPGPSHRPRLGGCRLATLALALAACGAEERRAPIEPAGEPIPSVGRDSSSPAGATASLYRFEDFPAGKVSGVERPAEVDLNSHPDAREFRTVLRSGAARGPNFAGSFTVVTWGCGTMCQQVRIVDARTGRVHEGPVAALGVDYRLGSRLLVVNPPERAAENPCPECRTLYYVWNDEQLRRLEDPGSDGNVVRAWVDSVRIAEAQRRLGHAPSVVREGLDRLVLTARNGTRVVLDDQVRGDEVDVIHLFRGYVRAAGSYLVEVVFFPEGGQYLLVHALSGKIIEVDAEPLPSPDGRRFVTASADVVAGHRPNRLRVYRAEPNGPVLEFEVVPEALPHPRNWGAESPVWLDDRTILFQRMEVDFTTAPLTFRHRPQRLELTADGWRLRAP